MKRSLVLPTALMVACLTVQTVGPQVAGRVRGGPQSKIEFPVKSEIFIAQFQGAEGITFNAEGRLFIGANNSIWIAEPDGSVKKIADVYRPSGRQGIASAPPSRPAILETASCRRSRNVIAVKEKRVAVDSRKRRDVDSTAPHLQDSWECLLDS